MECELDFAFVDGRHSKVVECDDRGHWSDLYMECVCKYNDYKKPWIAERLLLAATLI